MSEIFTNSNLDFLSGGGEMGERIRNFDWSQTPLGNPNKWEGSLKTCVRIMLTSPQPMFVWWGDELINIYNDAYRDVLGAKHPVMLGVSGKIVWKEIWDDLSIRVKTVFEKNEGTFDDALLLIMNRYGYDEETYFKFSYNPIPGTKKTTEGLFCVCTEETQRIINERTLDTLRKLGEVNFTEKSLDIIYRNVAEALAINNKDFPFALVHKITEQSNIVTVAASTGIDKNQFFLPDGIDTAKPTAVTKDFCEAFKENKLVVSEIKAEHKSLPTGAWHTAPTQFIYLPVSAVGSTHPYCIISAALNPHRKFDETYKQFCQLIADRVSIEINKMLALEIESKRAEAIAESDKAKIVFLSNISHEFRTPLTLMLSPLEEILSHSENNLNKSQQQNIKLAQRNAMRLLKLVNTLLDFSNIEKGKHQATFSLVNFVMLTKNLVANFRAIIEKAGMKLIVKADTINQPVYVDKQMWEKIVFNLLSNAFKYTLEGEITVELTAEKDFAVLKVKDTGVGIPENELPKMFERFHRIKNTAGRTYEGTGIGLSLIKELVLLHHGEISVDSVPKKGSVFTVKIPFGKHHVSSNPVVKTDNYADNIRSDIYVAEIETLLGTKKTDAFTTISVRENNFPAILVVDDNADMREHLSSLLSTNYNVITANNGLDALEKMKEATPALVLADIMMPIMDGIELLKEIKSNKVTAPIPVILLTARAGEESRIEGWESGADDYLVKPFSSKELNSRIASQIKTRQIRAASETILKNVLMEAPAVIAIFEGPQHRYNMVNNAYQKQNNRKEKDLLGKSLREVFPEFEGTEIFEIFDNVYKTGETFTASEYAVTMDVENKGIPTQRYFKFSLVALKNESKEIYGIMGMSHDITEHVETRKKNEDATQKLVLNDIIFKTIPDAIISSDVNGKVISWNKCAEELYGFSSEEMIGQIMPTIIHTEFIKKEQENWKEVFAQKGHWKGEITQTRKDGKKIYVSASAQILRNNQGEITGYVSVNRDITLQKEAEIKISESEAFSRTTLESSPDCVKVIDSEGRITYMNYNGLCLMEIDDFSEVKNKPWSSLWDEINKPIIKDAVEKSFTGKTSHFQAMRPTAKGINKWWDVIVSPIVTLDGKVTQLISVSRDITSQIETRKKNEEGEQRLRLATQISGVGIWEWNVKTNKIRWDEQMFRIYGIEPTVDGLVEYSTWSNAIVPQYLKENERILQNTVKNRGRSNRSFKIFRANDNLLCDIKATETVRINSQGEVEWVVGTNLDVTEQKIVEEKIKSSERKFQAAIDAVEGIIWTNNAVGEMVGEQAAWVKLTGQSYEEYQSYGWVKAVHPDDAQPTVDAWKNAVESKSIFEFEHRVKTKNDEWKLFSIKAIPVLNEKGNIQQWVGVHTDITEQRAAVQKIRASEERFRSLAQTLPQLVWVNDAEGNPEFASFRWKEYSGVEPGGDAEWKAIVHPDDYDAIAAAWMHSKATGIIYKHDVRLKNKDGEYRWHAGIGEAVLDEEKKIVKWVGAFTDIHDQKNIEQRLEEKVAARTAELEQKNSELQNLNKELEAFNYISSHDLQEPLRIIQMFAGRIADTDSERLSENGKIYLERMNVAATRMRTLIQDLLLFSRLNASEIKFEITDFSKIVEELKEELKETIAAKNAIIITAESCKVNVIPSQLRQLLQNLLGNALKFSKSDIPPRIIMRSVIVKGKEVNNEKLLPKNMYCHISVTDNGIGFEKKFSERIFQVFQRLHSKEKYPGTGIGLAIVKKIVDNHNGIITAESELGKSTTFNIYLPTDTSKIT